MFSTACNAADEQGTDTGKPFAEMGGTDDDLTESFVPDVDADALGDSAMDPLVSGVVLHGDFTSSVECVCEENAPASVFT